MDALRAVLEGANGTTLTAEQDMVLALAKALEAGALAHPVGSSPRASLRMAAAHLRAFVAETL